MSFPQFSLWKPGKSIADARPDKNSTQHSTQLIYLRRVQSHTVQRVRAERVRRNQAGAHVARQQLGPVQRYIHARVERHGHGRRRARENAPTHRGARGAEHGRVKGAL